MSEINGAAHAHVEDARIILETLGMDAERSNERSGAFREQCLRIDQCTGQ